MVDKSARFATINTKVAATEIRSSNKPIPGPPGGNIENSRCTLVSLSALNSVALPKWSYTPITLLGDARRWPSGVRRGDQEIWGFLRMKVHHTWIDRAFGSLSVEQVSWVPAWNSVVGCRGSRCCWRGVWRSPVASLTETLLCLQASSLKFREPRKVGGKESTR
jgi:hypothetical protein